MAEMNGQVVGSSAIRISWGRSTSRTAALQAQQQRPLLAGLAGAYGVAGGYAGLDPYAAVAGVAPVAGGPAAAAAPLAGVYRAPAVLLQQCLTRATCTAPPCHQGWLLMPASPWELRCGGALLLV